MFMTAGTCTSCALNKPLQHHSGIMGSLCFFAYHSMSAFHLGVISATQWYYDKYTSASFERGTALWGIAGTFVDTGRGWGALCFLYCRKDRCIIVVFNNCCYLFSTSNGGSDFWCSFQNRSSARGGDQHAGSMFFERVDVWDRIPSRRDCRIEA